jgi:hypothetical protein
MNAPLKHAFRTTADRLRAEGREEGRAEGELRARAENILRILAARRLPVSDSLTALIRACRDVATLDRWLVRAIHVTSAEQLFREE